MAEPDSKPQNESVQRAAFYGGMMEAVRILRVAAADYEDQAAACSKVAETNGLKSAASILRAWANGVEINADTFLRAVGEGAV